MKQVVITDNTLNSFRMELQRHLNEGYKLVPETLNINQYHAHRGDSTFGSFEGKGSYFVIVEK